MRHMLVVKWWRDDRRAHESSPVKFLSSWFSLLKKFAGLALFSLSCSLFLFFSQLTIATATGSFHVNIANKWRKNSRVNFGKSLDWYDRRIFSKKKVRHSLVTLEITSTKTCNFINKNSPLHFALRIYGFTWFFCCQCCVFSPFIDKLSSRWIWFRKIFNIL